MNFASINKAYNQVFQPNSLSIGVVVPIERYELGAIPSMRSHVERVQLVEKLGFSSIWLRDVPFNVPAFGDVGQTYDPFTYLGYLAASTKQIALGIASIALPLHHPVHVAKSAATIDQLSNGRLILGVASGDRPTEYPAMNIDFAKRDELFRDAFSYIRKAQSDFPVLENNQFGQFNGQVDILPKPTSNKIPMLVTGHSRQSLDWIAQNGDGWIYYPRHTMQQAYTIAEWRRAVAKYHTTSQPFMQPLYVIWEKDDDFKPQPIQLGFRIGANYLIEYFKSIQEIGVNHVAINLRFNSRKIEDILEELATKVVPHFHSNLIEK